MNTYVNETAPDRIKISKKKSKHKDKLKAMLLDKYSEIFLHELIESFTNTNISHFNEMNIQYVQYIKQEGDPHNVIEIANETIEQLSYVLSVQAIVPKREISMLNSFMKALNAHNVLSDNALISNYYAECLTDDTLIKKANLIIEEQIKNAHQF